MAAGVAVVAAEVVVSGDVNGENFDFHGSVESECGFGKMESGKCSTALEVALGCALLVRIYPGTSSREAATA